MAHRIPDSELVSAVEALLTESLQPRDQPDLFVLAISPADLRQQLEEAWLHDALAELGLADLASTTIAGRT